MSGVAVVPDIDDIESTDNDRDTVSQSEIRRLFNSCELVAEKVISDNYILHLAGTS